MASHASDPLIGQLVDNRYFVLSKIAAGGMATVYLARDERLGREVALKVMHAHLALSEGGAGFVTRFHREAKASASLTHPGLVAIFDQGVDGPVSYLAMEYVEGVNLRTVLAKQSTLSVGRALRITEQVLDALALAHSKDLVHRDIKPENVLINSHDRVKLADFGLARAVTEVTSTSTGTLFGTVAYLSPELITTGFGDTRSDLYAIGVMLFEMISGRPPVTGQSPIHVAFQHANADIPALGTSVSQLDPAVDRFVASLVARDPDKRPHDASVALEQLRSITGRLSPQSLAVRAVPLPADSETDTDPGDETAAPSGSSPDDSDIGVNDLALLREPPGPVQLVPSRAAQGKPDPNSQHTQALTVSGSTMALPLAQIRELEPAADSAKAASKTTGHAEPKGGNARPKRVGRAAGSGSGAVKTKPAKSVAKTGTKKTKKSRGKLITIWLIILLLLAGATYGGLYWWNNVGPGAYTQIPFQLVNVPLDQALLEFDDLELATKVATAYDDVIAEDHVIRVSPEVGTRVRKGSTVTLTQSLGLEHHKVPTDIVGLEEEDGLESLESTGFTNVSAEHTYATGTTAGIILQMSVEQGQLLAHNTKIVLTVSDGPEPITIPEVTGKSEESAKAELSALELKVDVKSQHHASVEEGLVISQSPEKNSDSHRGSEVTITVSLGPEMIAVPNVSGKSTSAASAELSEAGFKVETSYYLDGFFDRVRFQEPNSGTLLPKGSTVTITVF